MSDFEPLREIDPSSLTLFPGGEVMVFDKNGQQLHEYQGKLIDIVRERVVYCRAIGQISQELCLLHAAPLTEAKLRDVVAHIQEFLDETLMDGPPSERLKQDDRVRVEGLTNGRSQLNGKTGQISGVGEGGYIVTFDQDVTVIDPKTGRSERWTTAFVPEEAIEKLDS
jgi:hypothetical protein